MVVEGNNHRHYRHHHHYQHHRLSPMLAIANLTECLECPEERDLIG
jgi:hypothetical protein